MTWRKRQEHVMDGDIVEPSEWRINMNEFASEINGFLDNDNLLAESLDASHVKRDTFTKVLINQEFSQYGYLFSHSQSGWTDRADFKVEESLDTKWTGIACTSARNRIAQDSYDMGHYPPKFSAWKTRSEASGSPIIAIGTDSLESNNTQLPYHSFSTETDALIIVDFHGTVSWQVNTGSMHSKSDFINHWAWLLGMGYAYADATRGSAGFRYHTSGYPFYRPSGPRYMYKNARILCSMWRIVVDGMIVSETGPLGAERAHHPIYLCGAIPVSSGKHRVELQAQFVWYVPGTGKVIQSASLNPAYHASVTVSGTDVDARVRLRHDCELRWPNLIAQIRSR